MQDNTSLHFLRYVITGIVYELLVTAGLTRGNSLIFQIVTVRVEDQATFMLVTIMQLTSQKIQPHGNTC